MPKNLGSSSPLAKPVWFVGVQVVIVLTLILAACDSTPATTVPLTPLPATVVSIPSLDNSLPTVEVNYDLTRTASYPTSTSTPAIPSSAKACQNDDLNITGTIQTANQMGQRYGYELLFTNQMPTPCFLQGFAKVDLLDQSKQPAQMLGITYRCSVQCGNIFYGAETDDYKKYTYDNPIINLPPGSSAAERIIIWRCGAPRAVEQMNILTDKSFIMLTLPNELNSVVIQAEISLCKNGTIIYRVSPFEYPKQ